MLAFCAGTVSSQAKTLPVLLVQIRSLLRPMVGDFVVAPLFVLELLSVDALHQVVNPARAGVACKRCCLQV